MSMLFPSSKLPRYHFLYRISFDYFFFGGACEESRKITWVSWKSICLRKEYGGLGVRQLREFNLTLLGKWCWRTLVDREGLWF
jgi:hypothetical protein